MKRQEESQQRTSTRDYRTAFQHYGKYHFDYQDAQFNTNGYARWSDYITDEESSDLSIPREPTYLSDITRVPVDETDDNSAKQSSAQASVTIIRTVREEEKSPSRSISPKNSNSVSEIPLQPITKYKMPIPNSEPLPQSNTKIPFTLSNVSSVKKRESSGGRRSEQFLLELLKSTHKQKELQKQEQKEKELEQRKKQQKRSKGRKNQWKSSKASSEDKDQHREQPDLIKRISDKYSIKSLVPISEAIDGENKRSTRSTRSKRVTINHRGKIKLPTDSISLDYQPLLPTSLKKGLEATYHKRNHIEEESPKRPRPLEQQDDNIIESSDEDRDQSQDQQEVHIRVPQLQEKSKKLQEKKRKSKKYKPLLVKKSVPKQSGPPGYRQGKCRGTVRNKSKVKKKVSTQKQPRKPMGRPAKSKEKSSSLKSSQVQEGLKGSRKSKQSVRSSKSKKISREVKALQPIFYKMVKRDQDDSQVSPRIYTRHKKVRPQTNNQVVDQEDHKRLGLLSSEDFLLALGFGEENIQRIQSQYAGLDNQQMVYSINLRAKERILSTGIDYDQLRKHLRDSEDYDSIFIQVISQRPRLKFDVEGVGEVMMKKKNESVSVPKRMSFQVINQAPSKTAILSLTLLKSES